MGLGWRKLHAKDKLHLMGRLVLKFTKMCVFPRHGSSKRFRSTTRQRKAKVHPKSNLIPSIYALIYSMAPKILSRTPTHTTATPTRNQILAPAYAQSHLLLYQPCARCRCWCERPGTTRQDSLGHLRCVFITCNLVEYGYLGSD